MNQASNLLHKESSPYLLQHANNPVHWHAWNENSFYRYFCSNGCYNDFANKHVQQIVAIAPRLEALETPIEDPKKTTHTSESRWGNHSWTTTEIKVVDINGG